MLPRWVVVMCAYGTCTLELALSEAAYNGLAAWLLVHAPAQPRPYHPTSSLRPSLSHVCGRNETAPAIVRAETVSLM